MKWIVGNCKYGDIIRVKLGSVLHYGIYVSDGEVIQFGLPPAGRQITASGGVVVCSTDIDEFACGNFVEVGTPEKKEKKDRFKPEKTVEIARSRLGEGGYNVLHNNCEHFANECYFGVHRCEQEERMRKKWLSRPILNVYICPVRELTEREIYPEERQKEIASVKNENLKRQKTATWSLLETAAKHTFGYDFKELDFVRQRNGKWLCDKFWFSLSHTDGYAVAAVSNAPVGTDAENEEDFRARWKDISARRKFAGKIAAEGESRDLDKLLLTWLKKESAYKAFGKGAFKPWEINVDGVDFAFCGYNGTIVAVCGRNLSAAHFFKVENQEVAPIKF